MIEKLPDRWIEVFLASGTVQDVVYSEQLELHLEDVLRGLKRGGVISCTALDGSETWLRHEAIEGWCITTPETQAQNYHIARLREKLLPKEDNEDAEPWR